MSDTVCFHLGLHKSGSTFLQDYFAWDERVHDAKPRADWRYFAVGNAFNFDEAAASAYVARQVAEAVGKPVVLSHERLSGNPLTGYHDQREIADRIRLVAPGARVLLVVREQYGFMASAYKQYIRVGGTKLLRDFLVPTRDGHAPLFDPRPLRYTAYVLHLRALFGAEGVRVLPFELLRRDPVRFLQAVNDFFGIPPTAYPEDVLRPKNVGASEGDLDAMRFHNLAHGVKRSFRDPFPSGAEQADTAATAIGRNSFLERRTLVEEARAIHPGFYAESNVALSDLLGTDLAEFGYEMTP